MDNDVEKLEETFDEYMEQTMSKSERLGFEKKLESDPALKQKYENFKNSKMALLEIGSSNASNQLKDKVVESIHRKSGGRFFAKKSIGDRLPIGWLVALILLVLVALALTLKKSEFGGL